MKTIFKHIEGLEWDWFGVFQAEIDFTEFGMMIRNDLGISQKTPSLADLLANKSWCKAIWGEYTSKDLSKKRCPSWTGCSNKAFQILQQQGEEKCIKYIKSTMV